LIRGCCSLDSIEAEHLDALVVVAEFPQPIDQRLKAHPHDRVLLLAPEQDVAAMQEANSSRPDISDS
jgi:hypothetical protein